MRANLALFLIKCPDDGAEFKNLHGVEILFIQIELKNAEFNLYSENNTEKTCNSIEFICENPVRENSLQV